MNKQLLFLILLLFVLLIRVQSSWPLEKPTDPEFESITIQFEPLLNLLSGQSQHLLPQPQAALLSGMVLGVKEDMPAEFKSALRRTSTIHMVVVSGQNLTLLSGFILSFVTILGRKKTILVSLGVIFFYAVLTGLQVPVLRAALMVSLASLAQLTNREGQSVRILLITALVMLIYQPNWLFSISFQLSFLATIGVVVVAPEVIRSLNFLPNLIKQDLGISFAAQALTWPVIAANFHQASLVGIFTNALVLWTVPFIMIWGALAILVSLISLPLGWVLALFPGTLLTYFVYIIEGFDRVSLASIYIDKTSPLVWLGYYILLLGIFLKLKSASKSVFT